MLERNWNGFHSTFFSSFIERQQQNCTLNVVNFALNVLHRLREICEDDKVNMNLIFVFFKERKKKLLLISFVYGIWKRLFFII